MHKPMTADELQAHDGISPEDKKLIEENIGQLADSPDEPRCKAMRGWLAALWEEMEPDDELRRDADMMVASWSDGWNYCLEYAGRGKEDGHS